MEGYRPEKGQLDRIGNEIEDRIYNTKDFDRTLVLDGRTRLVAKVDELMAVCDRLEGSLEDGDGWWGRCCTRP